MPPNSIEAFTPNDARVITDRIKTGVEAVWELIIQAYTRRAWDVLGYPSWDDYCTREFGTTRLRLPREERSEVITSLRESGLSIRAIASATGLDKETVNNATRQVSGNQTPDLEADELAERLAPVIGMDGKTYIPTPPNPRRRQAITDTFTTAVVHLSKAIDAIDQLSMDDRFTKNLDQIAAYRLSDLVRARDTLQRVIDEISPHQPKE